MSTPEAVPYDTGNPLLAPGSASLTTAEVMAQGGKLGVATIRTASATLTAFLTREQMTEWGEMLIRQANQMGGLIVAPPGAMLTTPLEAAR